MRSIYSYALPVDLSCIACICPWPWRDATGWFDAFFRQFQAGHTLFGLKYQDFVDQNEVELQEVMVLVPSLADRRALSRIYRQNQPRSQLGGP